MLQFMVCKRHKKEREQESRQEYQTVNFFLREAMSRWKNVPFNPSAVPPPGTKPPRPERVPQAFIEAMKKLTSEKSTVAQQANPDQAGSSTSKWKSSFTPIGDEMEESEAIDSDGLDRIYDPYSPLMSDTETDLTKTVDSNGSPPSQGTSLIRQRLSPVRGSRWDLPYVEPAGRTLNEREFSAGSGPTDGRGPESEGGDHSGYDSKSRPLDRRGCSVDRTVHCSSNQQFPPSYSKQATEEERISLQDYRRENSNSGRISPPRLHWDYSHQLPFVDKGRSGEHVSPNAKRSRSKNVVMDKNFSACDLCDIVVANGSEMDDHLDSKSHWDMLEYIQQNNNYDDMEIAFLQDVLMYKNRRRSQAIEEHALPALQENDHMIKVEMFHCAACKVFVYTSAAEVHSHITSREHLSNRKEFEVQQRRACLSEAKTMMQDLQPQLEIFLKGGSPFQ